MAKFVQKYFSDQPAWAKGVIGVVVVAGVAYAGFKIYQANKQAKDIADANTAADQAATDLAALARQGIVPSYISSQYEVFAQQLVEAMNGCGTDEDQIYQVFAALRNKADALQLIKSFGVRFYQPCAWTSPISYSIWLANDQAYGGGLPTWLAYDLSEGAIADINEILRNNGIDYLF